MERMIVEVVHGASDARQTDPPLTGLAVAFGGRHRRADTPPRPVRRPFTGHSHGDWGQP